MGYIVNKRRFMQTGLPFLLPYSNKSKVITYLTPDNFKGSDSTTWGDEYPNPMDNTAGDWELASDSKSVRLYNSHGYASALSASIMAPSRLYNFTVYIVAKYVGDGACDSFRAISSSPTATAYIFRDNSGSSSKALGSNFSSWSSGNAKYFSGTSAYDAFQAYAISHPRDSIPVHVLNNSNVSSFYRNGTLYPFRFQFYASGSENCEIYIKLLAIVSEAESGTVLQNNINFIRTQLNLT